MNNAPQLTYNAMPQELWSSDAAEPTPATGPYVGHDTGPLLDHPTVPSADVDSPNRSTFEGSRLDLPQTSTENHGWLPSVPTDDILPQTNFATTAGRPYQPPPSFASSANYQASSSVYGLQHCDLQATSHIAQQVFRDDPPSFQGREELRQIRGTLFVTAANNPYSGAGPGEGFFIADDDQADVSQTRWLVKDSRYDPNAYLHVQSRPGTVRGDTANAGTYQGPIPSEDWQNPQQLGPLASTPMSYYPGVDPTHRMRQAREVRSTYPLPLLRNSIFALFPSFARQAAVLRRSGKSTSNLEVLISNQRVPLAVE